MSRRFWMVLLGLGVLMGYDSAFARIASGPCHGYAGKYGYGSRHGGWGRAAEPAPTSALPSAPAPAPAAGAPVQFFYVTPPAPPR